MRRGIIITMVLLAVPTGVYAQAVKLDVLANAGSDGFISVNQIDINPAVDSSIQIDLNASQYPVGGLNGLQYSLSASLNLAPLPISGPNTGDADWLIDPVAPYVNGVVFLAGDYISGIGTGAVNGQPLATANTTFPELYFKTFGTATTVGLVATYTLVPNGLLTEGDRYHFTAIYDPGFGNGPSPGGPGAWDQTSLSLQVNIIPEPVGVLLILGALPFIVRRRR